MEESLSLSEYPGQGRGVVARRRFATGECVLIFQGKVLLKEEIHDFTHCLEIDCGVFLGPSGGADDHVNHSCDPNCAVFFEQGRPVLRALVDIGPNDQVTFDYSTVMCTDPTSFICRCGSVNCRGRISAFDTLPEATKRRYDARSMVPKFVLAATRASRRSRRRLKALPQSA
jgi:hypothetical protein